MPPICPRCPIVDGKGIEMRPYAKTALGTQRYRCPTCGKTASDSDKGRGRPPVGDRAMTSTERSRKCREAKRGGGESGGDRAGEVRQSEAESKDRKSMKDAIANKESWTKRWDGETLALIEANPTLALKRAIWLGYIDGWRTGDVAVVFKLSQRKTLSALKAICSGKDLSGFPFEYVPSYPGVIVKKGSVFTFGDDANFSEGKRGVNHYNWFYT